MLPVAPEREWLLMRLKKLKLMDYEEMEGLESETNKIRCEMSRR